MRSMEVVVTVTTSTEDSNKVGPRMGRTCSCKRGEGDIENDVRDIARMESSERELDKNEHGE